MNIVGASLTGLCMVLFTYCESGAGGGTTAGPRAPSDAAPDESAIARVDDEAISFRFFKDIHERTKSSLRYRGKQALLDHYIDAVLLSREADRLNVPESNMSKGMVPRQSRAFYRELLERCGHPINSLSDEFGVEYATSTGEITESLGSLRGPLGIAREKALADAEAGKLVVVKVGGRPFTLADVSGSLNEQEWADFTTGSPEARQRAVQQFAEGNLLQMGFDKYKNKDAAYAEECLARIKQKYRAQDMLTRLGLTAEGEDETPEPDITDAEVQAYYEAHKSDFVRPSAARARHIRVATQEKADRLKEQIEKGADFAALAREHSLAPDGKDGGMMQEVKFGLNLPLVESYVFLLPPGKVGAYFVAQDHYEVIQTLSVEREALPVTDPGVRHDIRFRLAEEKRKQNLHDLMERLRKAAVVEVNRVLLESLK